MQYGDFPCCRTECPTTTADTTAELGCKPWHWAIVCECRLIHPAADRECAVPALPEPCCHHGAQVRRLPYSLSGFPAVPLQRLSMLLHKIDRQVTFTGISAGPWLANTTAVLDAKRHGKRLRLMRAVILFVSFKILGYSILTGYSA